MLEGAPSTTSLASLRPREVTLRTALMTLIFLLPKSLRTTVNSVFSSSSAAGAAPLPPSVATGMAAMAMGAAALTPNVSSSSLTSSASSSTDIPLIASRISSFVAMGSLLFVCLGWLRFADG